MERLQGSIELPCKRKKPVLAKTQERQNRKDDDNSADQPDDVVHNDVLLTKHSRYGNRHGGRSFPCAVIGLVGAAAHVVLEHRPPKQT